MLIVLLIKLLALPGSLGLGIGRWDLLVLIITRSLALPGALCLRGWVLIALMVIVLALPGALGLFRTTRSHALRGGLAFPGALCCCGR